MPNHSVLTCACRTATSEYFSFGHDEVMPLWDDSINKHHKAGDQISFFFAGIGDARHLFGTMVGIEHFEFEHRDAPRRKFHFTINDVKVPAIARDLVIFALLQDLAELEDTRSGHASLILGTLHYVFSGAVMPAVAHGHLQFIIRRILNNLENAEQPLPWLYILTDDFPSIMRCLRYWLDEVLKLYSASDMVDIVANFMRTRVEEEVTPNMKAEDTVYVQSGVLFPPAHFLEIDEQELGKLLKEGTSKPKTLAKKVAKLAKETWHINPTMVDYEWVKDHPQIVDVGHNPFGSIFRMFKFKLIKEPKNAKSLYEYMSVFFLTVVRAMKSLKGRFIVEAVLGDCAQTLEEIRLGVINHKDSGANDPTAFPTRYDRIHMSNIP